MIQGINIHPLKQIKDDRGKIMHMMRTDSPVFKNGGVGYRDYTGNVDREDAINQTYGATYTSGDVIGIALDANTGTVWFSKNGTWQNSATASEIAAGTTTNSAVTGLNGSNYNKPSGNFIYDESYLSFNF